MFDKAKYNKEHNNNLTYTYEEVMTGVETDSGIIDVAWYTSLAVEIENTITDILYFYVSIRWEEWHKINLNNISNSDGVQSSWIYHLNLLWVNYLKIERVWVSGGDCTINLVFDN